MSATQAPSSSRLLGFRERLRDLPLLRSWMAAGGEREDLDDDALARVRHEMEECVARRGGEVSARMNAARLGGSYLRLSSTGRQRFLALMATEFGIDQGAVEAAAQGFLHAAEPGDRERSLRHLREALRPSWLRLLRQFLSVPAGPAFLVDLRADLLRFAREDPRLAPLEQDLKDELATWFDVEFLELRRITWDSPASLLEKLASSEAVHAVSSWDDLKNRLDLDRRLFAFFHPRMPDEPLIFVEVALVDALSDRIAPLLDTEAPMGDPSRADTAIFYSISNAQAGLAGISFGGFLIKRVVDELSEQFPRVTKFATLSPVPGFRAWLLGRLDQEARAGLAAEGRVETIELRRVLEREEALAEALGGEQVAEPLRAPFLRLCAEYLLHAKRPDGRALDPVANFHLSNGARIERINWLADTSPKGIRESAGLMVNYLYPLADIEANHEAYTGEHAIAHSSKVGRLLRES